MSDFLGEFHISHICSHKNKSHVLYTIFPPMTPALTCSSPNVAHRSQASPVSGTSWVDQTDGIGISQPIFFRPIIFLVGIVQFFFIPVFSTRDPKKKNAQKSNNIWDTPTIRRPTIKILPLKPTCCGRSCRIRCTASSADRSTDTTESLPAWTIARLQNHMGFSKNTGTPKWMVKIMENPIKMDDLGVPLFLETHIAIVVRFNPIITESNDILYLLFFCLNRLETQ